MLDVCTLYMSFLGLAVGLFSETSADPGRAPEGLEVLDKLDWNFLQATWLRNVKHLKEEGYGDNAANFHRALLPSTCSGWKKTKIRVSSRVLEKSKLVSRLTGTLMLCVVIAAFPSWERQLICLERCINSSRHGQSSGLSWVQLFCAWVPAWPWLPLAAPNHAVSLPWPGEIHQQSSLKGCVSQVGSSKMSRLVIGRLCLVGQTRAVCYG